MRVLITLLTLLATTGAYAVTPQFWRVRSVEDFLAGDVDGFAVTSRGELRAGPGVHKVAGFNDPFVLAQSTAPNGDRFFGTGNEGKVYRLRGSELKAIYTAPEPEVYALAFREGALYAATSPNGKVYRIDPNDGKASVFYDPKQAYIWALQFDREGNLLVGTGVDGKLFRVTPRGEGSVLFDAPETHIRSLAVARDGSILAGGSGKGRIYAITSAGSAHALYDSNLSEISTVYVDASGIGWAAGVSSSLPSAAPAKPAAKPAQPASSSSSGGSASGEQKKDESAGNVEVSFSFDDSASGAPSQAATGELYRINPDGFVEVARKFEHEMVYSISGGSNGSILLSTGPQGRVYSYKDGEVSLIANVPEKQVVSIDGDGGGALITTTNAGAVYRLDNTPSPKAEYRSAAKDVERFSRFGHYRIEGRNIGDGHLAIAFRTGNTRTPDATWSAWSQPQIAAEGLIDAPAGRYVQWKLTMPRPAAALSIDSVTVSFVNRNVAPVIDSVAVQDPAVIFLSGSYPSSPQVVEATNPDEYGIFTSLDTPREKNEQGKKMFRKGYRTVSWRAHDDNGDNLRYSLAFRLRGSQKWLRLRDNLDETQMNFDTSQMPDGVYELRLTASDALDNPDTPMTDVKEDVEFQVDNAPPVISASIVGEEVVVRVSDRLSTIGKVEYSADAQKWIRLVPVDGIADASEETYKLPRAALSGKYVIVRAVDGFYNVATESVTVP
jgi:hypothetical protein